MGDFGLPLKREMIMAIAKLCGNCKHYDYGEGRCNSAESRNRGQWILPRATGCSVFDFKSNEKKGKKK